MRVIATAGHVDHGKSTLLRLLTGMEPDRWSQERERGMTIDLGFAWTTGADGRALAFVDVPGHERFVPNMLAGIGPVPAVLFVVAADEGWQQQSTEHLDALDALGVRHGLLAVTRCDLADPAAATEQAQQHLRESSLGQLPAVHVSGRTGAGLDRLREQLDLLAAGLPDPDRDADVRLWIDRAFTIKGAGTVVTGTLPAGTLRTGDQLRLHPGGRKVAVRGLQALGTDRPEVAAVARVAVNLRGVPLEEVRRGHALLSPDRWLSTDVVDVRLGGELAAELPRELMLHIGSAAVPVRVRPLGADTARLALRSALPLRIGDVALLRDPGSHRITTGVVALDVRPPRLRRRGAARERARVLADMDGRPDGAGELRRRRIVARSELIAMGAEVPPETPQAAGWLLDPDCRDRLAAELPAVLERHRAQDPLADGMPAEAARRELGLPTAALLDPLLAADPRITTGGGRLRLGGAQLPPAVAEALRRLRTKLTDAPFDAPTAAELAELGLGERELAAAERAGELLRLGPGLVLLPDAPELAVQRLAELPAPFTLSTARRALATSRRVAVPLLELLAARGRTEHLPDGTHRLRPGV